MTVPGFGEDYVVGINTQLGGYSVRTKEDWPDELVENREIVKESGSNRFTESYKESYVLEMKEAPRRKDLERARETAVNRVD